LAKAIQDDPLKGPFHRPKDASVSSVSRDVVYAIGLISPFVSAYKSVSKRRALPWDPNMGEEAGELDSFVRHLIMRLLNSLKGMHGSTSCKFRFVLPLLSYNVFAC
jgi:exocyst complex component 7